MQEGGETMGHPTDKTPAIIIETASSKPSPETTTTGSAPKTSIIRKLTRGLTEVVRFYDVRDKKIVPGNVTEQLVADAVGRLTHTTKGNAFDVRSVVAELGYYGDPEGNPDYLRVEEEARKRLLGLTEKGATEAIILEDPNLHNQRLMFRVTDIGRRTLREIAGVKK